MKKKQTNNNLLNNSTSNKKGRFNLLEFISSFLYKCVDFVITIILEIFGYAFYGVYVFISTIAKGIKIVIKYTLVVPIKFIFSEIWLIIVSFTNGIIGIWKFIFKKRTRKRKTKSIQKSTTSIKESNKKLPHESKKTVLKKKPKGSILSQNLKSVPNRIKNYFVNKYNNLIIVKHYRNKRERELEILYIDKTGKDAKRTAEKHIYKYLARNKEGKLIKGYFSALSKLDTHSYLLDEGYEVYEISTNWWIDFVHGSSKHSKTPMKQKDLIFWLTQLSTYVKSGVPLTDAVKILAAQNKRKNLKKIYDSIIYELTMGKSFSESLAEQGKVFPPLLINMLKAAEMIGDLEGTLDEMASYYQQREDTKKAMISALIYPTLIFIFAVFVISFILIYIIPRFESIYAQIGVEITGITALVLNISRWLSANYLKVILVILMVVLMLRMLYQKIKAFRMTVQYLGMKIPVVGKIIIYNEITLFSKTFASLNKNNILLTDSIELLRKITNNEIYKLIMDDTIANLLRGDKMSLSFKDNWAVPELAYYMITTGESTGELANMLDKVSEYYLGQQKIMAKVLQTFIEPITIILLAIIVGLIIIAVILPVFALYSSMQI